MAKPTKIIVLLISIQSNQLIYYRRCYKISLFSESLVSGTGSNPPLQPGWHRPILFNANQEPLSGPCTEIASIAYSEQVGEYLQDGGNIGLIAS